MIKGAVVDILVEYRKYLFLLNYFLREIATPPAFAGVVPFGCCRLRLVGRRLGFAGVINSRSASNTALKRASVCASSKRSVGKALSAHESTVK